MIMYLRFRVVGIHDALQVRSMCDTCLSKRRPITVTFGTETRDIAYRDEDQFLHVIIPNTDFFKKFTMKCLYCGRSSGWSSGEWKIELFNYDTYESKIKPRSFEDKLFKFYRRLNQCTE